MDYSYKYQYQGIDKNLSYFATYPANEWSFSGFKEEIEKGKSRLPLEKNLVASYKNSLKSIEENPATPEIIKNHCKELCKKFNDTTSSITNHYGDIEFSNIEIGDNNNVNNNIVYNNHGVTEAEKEEHDYKNKKRKVDSEAQSQLQQHQLIEEAIWEEWVNFLENANDDESIHKYSPQRYKVIICGKGVPPRQGLDRNNYYWLMRRLDDGNIILEYDVFKKFIDAVIDSETPDDMENILDNAIPIKGYVPLFRFIKTIFTIMKQIYRGQPSLCHSESVFNANLIFPCLNAVIAFIMDWNKDNIDNINNDMKVYFVPGEEQLVAMTKQLQRIGSRHDDRYKYSADGIVRLENRANLEIMILETSGNLGNSDNTKISFDLHKSMFGLLAMMKTIADKHEYATLDSFKKLKLYVIHASEYKCRIWSLSYKKENVFVFCRDDKVIINQNFNEKEDYLLPIVSFFGNLKEKLMGTINQLNALQNEHKDIKRSFRYESNATPILLSKTINPTILRLTQNSDAKGLGDELPGSSPGYFDEYYNDE